MHVECQDCNRIYDDATRWTICPHSPLGMPINDLCPVCDTLQSIHGPCKHQAVRIMEEASGSHFLRKDTSIWAGTIALLVWIGLCAAFGALLMFGSLWLQLIER